MSSFAQQEQRIATLKQANARLVTANRELRQAMKEMRWGELKAKAGKYDSLLKRHQKQMVDHAIEVNSYIDMMEDMTKQLQAVVYN